MDNNLKQKLAQMEQTHKQYLKKHRWGERFQLFGQSGFALVGNGLIFDAINVFIHGTVFLIIMAFAWKFFLSLIIYAGIHLAFLLFGNARVNKYSYRLDRMQEEMDALWGEYYARMRDQFGIEDGCVAYDDGVVVGNGSLAATKAERVPQMEILQLSKFEEADKFDEFKRYTEKGTINDYIASLEFRKQFGIKTHFSATNDDYMRFFTPDVQLGMVRSMVIKNFSGLEVLHDRVCAKFEGKVELPKGVDVYEKAPLEKYFLGVNEYCLKMRQMADRVHGEFAQMAFLRGA